MKRKISIWVEPVIDSGDYVQLELFNDEQVIINSSIQNIFDISKVFTDYSQSFTIPASTINNVIFKHFYQTDIGDINNLNGIIDHNKRRKAFIEIDLTPFRRGKISLEKANIKNGAADNYQIVFYGDLISLKDKFGEDKLNQLDYVDYEFPYNGTEVFDRVTDYNNVYDVRFPLISSSRLWSYNDSGPDDITQNTKHINYNELFPALRVKRILGLIGDTYGISFNGAFLSDERYTNAFLLCKNANEFNFITESLSLMFDSKSNVNDINWSGVSTQNAEDFVDLGNESINITNFNTQVYQHKIQIYVSSISAVGTLYVDVFQDGNYYQTFQTGIPNTFNIVIPNTSGLNTNFTFKLRATTSMNVGCTVFYQPYAFTYNAFTSTVLVTYSTATINCSTVGILGTINLASYMPDMKIADFVAGILKEFNCTCIPISENTYEILPLDDWYGSGAVVDITQYTDIQSIDIERIKLYKKIAFKYQESESFANKRYFEANGQHYGNVEYQYSYDGDEYIIESPFENLLFQRVLDNVGDYAILGYNLDTNYNSYVPKPTLLYEYGASNSLVHNIKFNDGSVTQSISKYMLFGQDLTYNGTKYSLNFGADNSIIHNETIQYGLFATYYFPYLTNLYNLKNRLVYVKTNLPISILTNLQLNDRLIIRDKRYIINEMKSNLTSGEVEFVLYLDFREVIGGINDGRPIQVDGTAQCISQKVTLPSGATQCDLTCATAGVTITPSTIYSSQVVEICVPVSATPKQKIITENNNNLTLENNTQVISELYQPQVINVLATFTYATGTQTSSLIIIQI